MSTMQNRIGASAAVTSTAGAVAFRNAKGETSMQKVKVERYITGRRPGYARKSSSESEENDNGVEGWEYERKSRRHILKRTIKQEKVDESESDTDLEVNEEVEHSRKPKVRNKNENGDLDSLRSRRVLAYEESSEENRRYTANDDSQTCSNLEDSKDELNNTYDSIEVLEGAEVIDHRCVKLQEPTSVDDAIDEKEMDDNEKEKHREFLRQRTLGKAEQELLVKEDDTSSSNESNEEYESETEYEDYAVTDSEEERPKPVFVRKDDRLTTEKRVNDAIANLMAEEDSFRRKQERRQETLRTLEEDIRKEKMKAREKLKADIDSDGYGATPKLNDVDTTDEDEEDVGYHAWKVRELKRIKRDRDEKEVYDKEQSELERFRLMTNDERCEERKLKPRVIVNKGPRGKYKFMQKYYHRGSFYLDKEDDVFKKDFAQPTLEDHFDKLVLPAVLQVKNFGKSSRTKYTHLKDQDTSNQEAGWAQYSALNDNFTASCRRLFEKPTLKRNKPKTDS